MIKLALGGSQGLPANTVVNSLPSGIVEPGEQPAPALASEIEEETAVQVEGGECLRPAAADLHNHDPAQHLDWCFLCRP